MMFSAKDINIKDAPDVRAMLTVVIRVRLCCCTCERHVADGCGQSFHLLVTAC